MDINYQDSQAALILENQIRSYMRQPIPRFTVLDIVKNLFGRLASFVLGNKYPSYQIAWNDLVGQVRKYKALYQQGTHIDYFAKQKVEELAKTGFKHLALRPLGLYQHKKYGQTKMLAVKTFSIWSHWLDKGLDRFAQKLISKPGVEAWSIEGRVARRLTKAREFKLIGPKANILSPQSRFITINGQKKQGKRHKPVGAALIAVLEALWAVALEAITVKGVSLAQRVYNINQSLSTWWQNFKVSHPKLARIGRGFSMAAGGAWSALKAAIPAAAYGFLTYTITSGLGLSAGLSIGLSIGVGAVKFATGFVSNLAQRQVWLNWSLAPVTTYPSIGGSPISGPVSKLKGGLARWIRFYAQEGSIKKFLTNKVLDIFERYLLNKAPSIGKVLHFLRNFNKVVSAIKTRFPGAFNLINNFFNPGFFIGLELGLALGLPIWQSFLISIGGSIGWTLIQRVVFSFLAPRLGLVAKTAAYSQGMFNFISGNTAAGLLGQLVGLGLGFVLRSFGISSPFIWGQVIGSVGFSIIHALNFFNIGKLTTLIGSWATSLLTSVFGASVASTVTLVFALLPAVFLTLFAVYVTISALSLRVKETGIFGQRYTSESPCFNLKISVYNANDYGSLDISGLSFEELDNMTQNSTHNAYQNDILLVRKTATIKSEMRSSEARITLNDQDSGPLLPIESSSVKRRFKVFKNGNDITPDNYGFDPEPSSNQAAITQSLSSFFNPLFFLPLSEQNQDQDYSNYVLQVLERYYPQCETLPDTGSCNRYRPARRNYIDELQVQKNYLNEQVDLQDNLISVLESLLGTVTPNEPTPGRLLQEIESLKNLAISAHEDQSDPDNQNSAASLSQVATQELEACLELDPSALGPEELVERNECLTHYQGSSSFFGLIAAYQGYLSFLESYRYEVEAIYEIILNNQTQPEVVLPQVSSSLDRLYRSQDRLENNLLQTEQSLSIARNPREAQNQTGEIWFDEPAGTVYEVFYFLKFTGTEDDEARFDGQLSADVPFWLGGSTQYCFTRRIWAINSPVASLANEFYEIITDCYGSNIDNTDFYNGSISCMTDKGVDSSVAEIVRDSAQDHQYYQCVGHALAISRYLGTPLRGAETGAQYAQIPVPGYRFTTDVAGAEPGDFLIFKATANDPYGHIALIINTEYESAGLLQLVVSDANSDYHGLVRINASYHSNNPSIAGILRRN